MYGALLCAARSGVARRGGSAGCGLDRVGPVCDVERLGRERLELLLLLLLLALRLLRLLARLDLLFRRQQRRVRPLHHLGQLRLNATVVACTRQRDSRDARGGEGGRRVARVLRPHRPRAGVGALASFSSKPILNSRTGTRSGRVPGVPGRSSCRVAARILLPALARPVAHKDSENGKLPKTILIFPGYGTEDLRGPRHLPQIRETRRKRMVGVPSRRAFLVAAVALLVCLAAADAAKPSKKGKSSVAPVQGGLQAGVQLVKNALAMVWKAVAAILGAVNPCLPNGIFDCGKSVQKFAGLSLLASSVPERLVAHILLAPVPRICVCSNARSMQTPSSKA